MTPGLKVDELDTPALTVDLDVLEHNIHEAANSCSRLEIPLRVHIKTHKIPQVAHMQMEAGAVGIACQKVGEAEVMVAAGIRDVLIPYNIVGRQKVERLVRLCRQARVMVAVDSETTAEGISKQSGGCEVGVLVELDTGGSRCGVRSPQDALELARKVVRLPGLDFRGVMTYPSRPEAETFLRETTRLLEADDIPADVVSGGGTGAQTVSKQIGCTEVRMGSYVFEGAKRVNRNDNPPNPRTCAQRMLVIVVSTPAPGRVIIDGGQKTFTSHPPTPYGYIMEAPDAQIYGMSVEHGHVDVTGCSRSFQVGDRLSVIPLHQGMTTNLHDEVYAVRNGRVDGIWQVAGRGRVR